MRRGTACRGAMRKTASVYKDCVVRLLPHGRISRPRRRCLRRRRGHRCCCGGRSRGRSGSRRWTCWLFCGRFLGGRFLCNSGSGRCRREFDHDRVGPESRRVAGRLNHLEPFRFRLIAGKCESDGHRSIDWQRKRAGRAAGLTVRCLGFGTRGFRLHAHRVQARARFQTIKAHPIGSRTRREGKRAANSGQNSIHHIDHPTRAASGRPPTIKDTSAITCAQHVTGHKSYQINHIPHHRRYFADETAAIDEGSSAKWLMVRSGLNSAIGRSL